jgi:hypothetical protein
MGKQRCEDVRNGFVQEGDNGHPQNPKLERDENSVLPLCISKTKNKVNEEKSLGEW